MRTGSAGYATPNRLRGTTCTRAPVCVCVVNQRVIFYKNMIWTVSDVNVRKVEVEARPGCVSNCNRSQQYSVNIYPRASA